MPDPLKKFNQPSGEMLQGTMSAMTLEQAQQTLWDSFSGFVDSSPWFKDYHNLLKVQQKKLGIELFKRGGTFLRYNHKHIIYQATGSQDRKMRGRTRIIAGIDELGWFVADEKKKDLQNANAEAVYTALSNSLATMRMKFNNQFTETEFDLPPILMLNISSPSAAKDYIMRLYKKGPKNPKMLAFQRATWHCVTGDTLIRTPDGFAPADSVSGLIGEDGRPFVKKEFEPTKIVRLRTASGITLRCTPDHKLEVLNINGYSFKKVSDLAPDDLLVRKLISPQTAGKHIDSKGLRLTSSLYYLLGAIVYGSTIDLNKIVVKNSDANLIDLITSKLGHLGIDHKTAWKKVDGVPSGVITIEDPRFLELVLSLGMISGPLHQIVIPDFALTLPAEALKAYLCGFMDQAGVISNREYHYEIYVRSVSTVLIYRLNALFSLLSVPSRISAHKNGKFRDIYQLRIYGNETLQAYKKSVGFEHTIKYQNLMSICTRISTRMPFNEKMYRQAIDCFLGKYGLYSLPYSTRKQLGPDKSFVSKKLLSECAASDQSYSRLLSCDELAEPYEILDENEVQPVYDFSIESDDHTYLSNSFVSHNCNPDYTLETLKSEFATMDPLIFNRDFGAEPPLNSEPFISDIRAIQAIATGKQETKMNVNVQIEQSNTGYEGYIYAEGSFTPDSKPRIAAFDLGSNKNALACCIMSLDNEGKPCLDYAMALYPRPGYAINIAKVFDMFTVPMVKSLNIKHVFFDRWQSLDQVHRLRGMKVNAEIYSLTYRDLSSVRSLIATQGVVLPTFDKDLSQYISDYLEVDDYRAPTPYVDLAIQLLTIRDLGYAVVKPLIGDDDIFRAFALGVSRLQEPAVKKQYASAVIEGGPRDNQRGLVVTRLPSGAPSGYISNNSPMVSFYSKKK